MSRNKKSKKALWLYLLAAILPYGIAVIIYFYFHNELEDISSARIVVISKEDMELNVYNYDGQQCFKAPIACGIGFGNKSEIGDKKTPEGIFHVISIEDASTWGHDFHDGKGRIEGAYGPYFIRLSVPGQKGIGIHGTHDPNSIGTRVTEGCIRLNNEDIYTLAKMVKPGTLVIIGTSKKDILNSERERDCKDSINGNRYLKQTSI